MIAAYSTSTRCCSASRSPPIAPTPHVARRVRAFHILRELPLSARLTPDLLLPVLLVRSCSKKSDISFHHKTPLQRGFRGRVRLGRCALATGARACARDAKPATGARKRSAGSWLLRGIAPQRVVRCLRRPHRAGAIRGFSPVGLARYRLPVFLRPGVARWSESSGVVHFLSASKTTAKAASKTRDIAHHTTAAMTAE